MKHRASIFRLALLLACAALAGACSPSPEPGGSEGSSPPSARPGEPPASAAGDGRAGRAPEGASPAEEGDGPLVVFLGDSLTAGLGVAEADAFPEQARQLLAAEGVAMRVVNAGVSGDTTAGGLARLDWVLRGRPDVLVVGLGANDGLRGLALEQSEANLRAIIAGARAAGARVLLLGMLLPPNYGPDYTAAFRDLYPRLADELEVPLVPFLLTGVAGIPELNQADGIHPTAEGHRLMAAIVVPELRPLLLPRPQPG